MLLIPTIGFGLLKVQPMGDPGDSVRLLLTVMSMVAGLGLLTLRLSVQSRELERADAQMRLLAAATEQTADLILITDAHPDHLGAKAILHARPAVQIHARHCVSLLDRPKPMGERGRNAILRREVARMQET